MSFPRAKITRFNETTRCGPGVGAYDPVPKDSKRTLTSEVAERFRGSNESLGSAPGSSFKVPRTPMHLPRDKLCSKMTELLQQLEDRDRLIAQLQLSIKKLTTNIGKLEGILCNMQTKAQKGLRDAKNATHVKLTGPPGATANEFSEGTILEEAADCSKEIRLSKDTEELRAEVFTMMKGLQDEQDTASAGSSQEMLHQLHRLSKELLLLKDEKEYIQRHQKHLLEHVSAWQTEQTTAVQQHTEVAKKLHRDLEEAKRTISELRDMLNLKDEKISKLEGMVRHEVAEHSEDSAINLQLEAHLVTLMEHKACLESELAVVKAELEDSAVDRATAENVFLQAHSLNEELEAKLLSASEKEDGLIAQVKKLEAQVAQLQIEGEELKKQVSLCNETASSLFTERNRLKNEVDVLNRQKLVLAEQVDELKAQKHFLDDKVDFEKDRADLALQAVQEAQAKPMDTAMKLQSALAELQSVRVQHASLAELHQREQAQKLATECFMSELQVSNMTLEDELSNQLKAFSKLQASQVETLAALQQATKKQIDTEASLRSTLDELQSLKAEHTTLADVHQSVITQKLAIEGGLDKTNAELSALQDRYAEISSELEAVQARNATLQDQLANKLEALSELRVSQLATQEALQDVKDNQVGTSMKLESMLDKLQSLKAEHTTLADDHRGFMMQKLAIEGSLDKTNAELSALQDRYAAISSELEGVQARNATLQDQLADKLEAFSELQASQLGTSSDFAALQKCYATVSCELDAIVASNAVLEAQLVDRSEALSELQLSHSETVQALKGGIDKQVDTAAKLQGTLDELKSIKSRHASLVEVNEVQNLLKIAIESSLNKTKSELLVLQDNYASAMIKLETAELSKSALEDQLTDTLQTLSELQASQGGTLQALQEAQDKQRNTRQTELSALQESHAATALELKTAQASNVDLQSQLASKLNMISELQLSQERNLKALQDAQEKQTDATRKLESSLYDLWSLQAEHAALAAMYKNFLKEVLYLVLFFFFLCFFACRWRCNYELLLARVAPFQEQLELYEIEKNLLEQKNQTTEARLSELNKTFSQIMGHQNHKQKIHYLSKVMDERKQYNEV
ncbi:unnamed protein product, partial [Ixodes hexagonus]